MKVTRREKRVGAWCLVAVLVMQPVTAMAQDVTVLVNGSFEAYPEWMNDGSAEFNAIAGTFGYSPTPFHWTDNDAVFPPFYDGIYSGAFALANFLNGVGGNNLNVISHSHGGNVTLIALWYLSRPVSHLINLGTPINWDLWHARVASGWANSKCQISSYVDYVQFSGSSPFQVFMFFYNEWLASYYYWLAIEAAWNGDWDAFFYYMWIATLYEFEAQWWWFTTKIEWGAPTYLFWGEDHSQLHEPPVWDRIKYQCALN